MENITNDETIKESSKILGHQVETLPQLDTSKIILTSEVNPKLLRRANIVRRARAANAISSTIYTTPTDKDFYITSVSISNTKDVTATSVNSDVRATIDGVVQNIIELSYLTLTAQNMSSAQNFVCPIKVDRGTVISVNNNTNVANIGTTGVITGYTVESTSNL